MKNIQLICLVSFFLMTIMMNAQDLTWVKRMGSKTSDNPYSIAVDGEGNVYTVGSFTGKADFDPGPDSVFLTSLGLGDIFISKLNSSGEFVWAKQIGGVLADVGKSIAIDPTGFIYVAGSFRDTVDFDPGPSQLFINASIKTEAFLMKLDEDGNLIWANRVTDSDDNNSADNVYGLATDDDGYVYVTGNFGDTSDFDPGPATAILITTGPDDIFIAKYDETGALIWAEQVGGPKYDEVYAMDVDGSGNVYITGNFTHDADFDPGPDTFILSSIDTTADAFALKLNSAGQFVWVKQFGGVGDDYGLNLSATNNGMVYVSGSYAGSIDFDPGPGVDMHINNGGDFYGFIVALDENGDYVWGNFISGPSGQEGYAISADGLEATGRIYLLGYFYDSLYFNNAPELSTFVSQNGSLDIFIASLDVDGNFKSAIQLGGPSSDFSYALYVGSGPLNKGVYSTGYFFNTADYDPGPDNFPITSAGSADIFVIKLGGLPTATKHIEGTSVTDVKIFPNPAREIVNILNDEFKFDKCDLTDLLGHQVISVVNTNNTDMITIDVSTLHEGIYILNLFNDHQRICKKIFVGRN